MVLAIGNADADADPLGHAVAVTDENIVTVHCTVGDEVQDYAAASLQQHTRPVAQSDRRRAKRHVERLQAPGERHPRTNIACRFF